MGETGVTRIARAEPPPRPDRASGPPLPNVRSWGYQMQDLDIKGAYGAPSIFW